MRWERRTYEAREADFFGQRAEREGCTRAQAKRRTFAELYGGPVIEGEVLTDADRERAVEFAAQLEADTGYSVDGEPL